MRIRPATQADISAIARIHVDSWRATYRGIVPDVVLEELSYTEHEDRWQLRIQPDAQAITLVAEDGDGAILGFVIGGKERTGDPLYDAELYAIYLDPGHMRQGTGTKLTRGLARALQAKGFHSLLVWVLAANPARHFYAALGGQFVREATITIGGAELPEFAYGWPTLATLAA
ncbi:MAG: GNAT family N-acetyltransferase [Caldilineaceae bacterium]